MHSILIKTQLVLTSDPDSLFQTLCVIDSYLELYPDFFQTLCVLNSETGTPWCCDSRTLGHWGTGTPGHWDIKTLEHQDTKTPGQWDTGTIGGGCGAKLLLQ